MNSKKMLMTNIDIFKPFNLLKIYGIFPNISTYSQRKKRKKGPTIYSTRQTYLNFLDRYKLMKNSNALAQIIKIWIKKHVVT